MDIEKTHRILKQSEIVTAIVNELLRESNLDPTRYDVASRCSVRVVDGVLYLSLVIDDVRERRKEDDAVGAIVSPPIAGKVTV